MPKLKDPIAFSLRLPGNLGKELTSLADQTKRSKNTVVTMLLEEALRNRAALAEEKDQLRSLKS